MKTWTSIALILALGLGACTSKKRDEALPYGADKDLLSLADYSDKEFSIKTYDVLASSQDKKTLKLNIKGSKSIQLRAFDFVKYDAAGDKLNLLDKSLVLGKINHSYRMRYEFEGTLLKVYKIASAGELSSGELATAEDLIGGGKDEKKDEKKVPIVAYRVSYFTVENQRNEKDETTKTLKLTAQDSKSNASHFKIDYNSKSLAKFVAKELVFRADIFDGDWYFATTTTSQNYLRKGYNGYMFTEDDDGQTSTKVRGQKRESALEFYNLNLDDRLKSDLKDRKENQTVSLSFNAEFLDYRMAQEGRTSGIIEEANTDVAWDQRKYVKLIFDKEPNLEILDIQVDDGYFSIHTFNRTSKEKKRIALYNVAEYRKSSPAYTPKVYLKEDKQVFGFFYETKNTLKSADRFRREDFEKDNVIDRYNPMREKIVFSLNTNAPEWSVELAQKSVDAWDQAFRQAGIGTKLELAKERAEVGDIRANVLNMIGDVDGNEPYWGVAPKVVDSETGEVISSTANVNLMSIIYRGEALVEQYLRAKSGLLTKNYLLGTPIPSLESATSPAEPGAKNETSKIATGNVNLDKMKLPKVNSATGFVAKDGIVLDATKAKKAFAKQGKSSVFHSEEFFEIVNDNVIPELEALCPQVKILGEQLASGATVDRTTDEFKKTKRACSMEVSKTRIISTMIHEMGHNFGLRHNFRGSNDFVNFFQAANGWETVLDKTTGKSKLPDGVALGAPFTAKSSNGKDMTYYNRTSSVMEYVTYNHDTMLAPGPYDVAALRWAYTGIVLDHNDKPMKVSDQKPLAEQVGNKMRAFAYCTDEDVDYYQRDSLCFRQDQGLTASEIAISTILQYNSYVASNYQKFDRNELALSAESRSKTMINLFVPLLKIYQDWRSMVAAEVGFADAYLERASPAGYLAQLDKITKITANMPIQEKMYRNRLADYRRAADMTFDFLMKLAFHPDYTCIVDRGQGDESDVYMISFAGLQRDIFDNMGVTVKTCKDAAVIEYLKITQKATLVGLGGIPSKDVNFDLADTAITNGPDRVGLVTDKAMAVRLMTVRVPLFLKAQTREFMPNFLDEPHYQKAFTTAVTERLELGLDLKSFGIKTEKPIISPLFENEKNFLIYLFSSLKEGLQIPGNFEASNRRLDAFRVLPSYYRSFSDMSQVSCASIQGVDYCAGPENHVSRSLLKTLGEIQNMKAAAMPSEQAQKIFLEIAKPLVPEKIVDGKTAYTGTQFLALLQAFRTKEAELRAAQKGVVADELQVLVQALMGSEIKTLNASLSRQLTKANSNAMTDVEYMGMKTEILKADIIKAAPTALTDDGAPLKFKLSLEFLEESLKEISEKVQKLKNAYQLDRAELQAQSEVLIQAIFLN